jgi:hypothetical protein
VAGRKLSLLLRAEDLLMAGWVAVATPLIFRAGGDRGPFDAGQPIEGVLRLGAVAAVLACLAARRKVEAPGAPPGSLISRGAVGPLTGALLLVTIGGFTALTIPAAAVSAVLLAAAIGMIAVHFAVPPFSVGVRRALVSPFVMIAGGLYWSLIEAVVGTPGTSALRRSALVDPRGAELALFFLVAFSAVYYAMLVYAPRQIAEREGGWPEWILRYVAFVASIALGVGWLSVLSA